MAAIQPDFVARPQLRLAVQRLVQWIHIHRLEPGDQLPPQEKLRVALGFHNKTLNGAMQILTTHGVIVRQRKVGTILIDAGVSIPGLWRVGITLLPAVGDLPFFGNLWQLLQTHLSAAGANALPFMLDVAASRAKLSFEQSPGLRQQLQSGCLDGLLDMAGCDGEDYIGWRKKGRALLHVGAWENAPAGRLIDYGVMVEAAVARLSALGCRRLAVVSAKGEALGFNKFWKGFIDATARCGIVGDARRSMFGGAGPRGGWRVAEQILALPSRERPDGLVVIDDLIGNGLTAALASKDPGYRPTVAVQTNRQTPLGFAFPVIHFELDAEELARGAVDLLMAQLLNPQQPLQRQWQGPLDDAAPLRHAVTSISGSAVSQI